MLLKHVRLAHVEARADYYRQLHALEKLRDCMGARFEAGAVICTRHKGRSRLATGCGRCLSAPFGHDYDAPRTQTTLSPD